MKGPGGAAGGASGAGTLLLEEQGRAEADLGWRRIVNPGAEMFLLPNEEHLKLTESFS